ncbi:hypothetical protein BDK51DRAFT_33578, partial [Blyttiomyces helicus]
VRGVHNGVDGIVLCNFTTQGTGVLVNTAFPTTDEMVGPIMTPRKEVELERASPEFWVPGKFAWELCVLGWAKIQRGMGRDLRSDYVGKRSSASLKREQMISASPGIETVTLRVAVAFRIPERFARRPQSVIASDEHFLIEGKLMVGSLQLDAIGLNNPRHQLPGPELESVDSRDASYLKVFSPTTLRPSQA